MKFINTLSIFILAVAGVYAPAQDTVTHRASLQEIAKRSVLKVDTIATVAEGGSRYNLQELTSMELGIQPYQAAALEHEIAVQVLGYYLDENGDPDGVFETVGRYILVHDETLTSNGGTVIAADHSFDSTWTANDAFWSIKPTTSASIKAQIYGATGDESTDDHEALSGFVDYLQETHTSGRIEGVSYISEALEIEASCELSGSAKNKGEISGLISQTGKSGIVLKKNFLPSDPNLIYIKLENLKVIEESASKTLLTSGLSANRVNVGLDVNGFESRGFDRGINLKGVIGGVLKDIFCVDNNYGLYTESDSSPGLPSYDCTNTQFLHGVLNANATGAYIGPISQGLNFFGTNIERNTIVGLEIAATPPASSNLNFFGCWFEENPIAIKFTEKPKTVQFDGCYFFNNTDLWDNAGSGVIEATFERCKIDGSNIDLDTFRGVFVENDVTNCTFTATSPEAYKCQEWRGTEVDVSGVTMFSTRRIGPDMYSVVANSDPGSVALTNGSEWHNNNTGKKFLRKGGVWTQVNAVIVDERNVNFAQIPAGGSAIFGPITVPGAEVGDFVRAIPSEDLQGLVFNVRASNANAVSGTIYNNTLNSVDLPDIEYRFEVIKN